MAGFTRRIPLIVSRDDLPADKRKFFDEVVSIYDGKASGPWQVLLHSPDLASRVARTAAYIRFETTLQKNEYELVVLTATRELDCQYAWTTHQPLALRAGVRAEAVAAIRDRKAPEGLTHDEALIFSYVQQLLRNHRVSEPTFRAALEELGLQKLVDLTVTVGHYGTLACILNAFEVEPNTPLLPA